MTNDSTNKTPDRSGERGAAMVMVLMVFLLLLVACTGVILEASMNTKKVMDYNSEQQAYYAAENGIQTALNVMRGNTVPTTLIDSSKPATHKSNKISFAKAVDLQDSNDPADTSSVPRLSRWIDYSYTPTGASNPDRVPVDPAAYSPDNDSAFSIEVFDPDNPGQLISLEVTADIDGSGNSKKFGLMFNTATIKYNSANKAGVGVSTREVGVNLGNFTVSTTGSGATVTKDTRVELKVKMTAPLKATAIIRGTLKAGKIDSGSMGDVKLEFDSGLNLLLGGIFRVPPVLALNPPSTNGGKTEINVSITISEPNRLLIRSTGYGPRGSKKVIEVIIMKDGFNGLIPATLMMVGKNVGSLLETGTLNTLTFSGNDPSTGQIIPPIGSSSSGGLTSILGSLTCLISCPGGGILNIIGNPSNVSEEMPEWISSPENLKMTITNLKARAISEGRYYSGGAVPPNFGNNADGVGITFIEGDGTFTGAGGGILVTTGKLLLKDDYNYNGIIVVTGEGGVVRQGSGTGVLNGNLVVSPIDLGNVSAGFKAPKFDATGIGSSELIFNANLSLADTSSTGVIVVGVVEK